MRSIKLAACLSASIGLIATPVAAQSDPAEAIETPKVVGKLFECRTIKNPDQCLARFDRGLFRS